MDPTKKQIAPTPQEEQSDRHDPLLDDVPESLPNDWQKEELKPDVVAVESQPDESLPPASTLPNPQIQQPTNLRRPEGKLKRLLKSKKFWLCLFLFLLAGVAAAWFIQPSRAWIVNQLGLRVPVTVVTRTVAEAGHPSAVLKSVAVDMNGVEHLTDDQGTVQAHVHYGQQTYTARKQGYETATHADYYDFNPFFNLFGTQTPGSHSVEMSLKGVGLPLKFSVKDWLTGQPLTKGDFSVGDVIAQPDENGIVSLKVPPTDAATVKVKAVFKGFYVDREFDLKVQAEPVQEEVFVPAGKVYFVSKRSGTLGVYSSDADGSNVKEVVQPSVNETAAVDFSVSPSGKYAVLASTREGKRDAAKQLIQKLYVVNLTTNQMSPVDEGKWFDFVDWSGDMLVYTASRETTSQHLVSIDMTNGKKTDIGLAANFGVVRVSLGTAVYIANLAADQPEAANSPVLRTVSVKGGTEKTIGNKVNLVSQIDFDRIVYQTTDNAWHEYNANTTKVSNVSAPQNASRAFLGSTSGDGQYRLVVDRVDGKNTLIAKSVASGEEKTLYSNANLRGPIRWAGNLVVFRVVDGTQTADYVVSVGGGDPKKVTDVTATAAAYSDSYFGFY